MVTGSSDKTIRLWDIRRAGYLLSLSMNAQKGGQSLEVGPGDDVVWSRVALAPLTMPTLWSHCPWVAQYVGGTGSSSSPPQPKAKRVGRDGHLPQGSHFGALGVAGVCAGVCAGLSICHTINIYAQTGLKQTPRNTNTRTTHHLSLPPLSPSMSRQALDLSWRLPTTGWSMGSSTRTMACI